MKDLKTNLLRHHQREELKAEIQQMEDVLPHVKPDDKPALVQRKIRAQKQLEAGSPEPLTSRALGR